MVTSNDICLRRFGILRGAATTSDAEFFFRSLNNRQLVLQSVRMRGNEGRLL